MNASSPIGRLISRTACCTRCGAIGVGACGCWEKCHCGWTRSAGGVCGNPACELQHSDLELAVELADAELIVLAKIAAAPGGWIRTRQLRTALPQEWAPRACRHLLAQMVNSGLLLSIGGVYEISRKGLASLMVIVNDSREPPRKVAVVRRQPTTLGEQRT